MEHFNQGSTSGQEATDLASLGCVQGPKVVATHFATTCMTPINNLNLCTQKIAVSVKLRTNALSQDLAPYWSQNLAPYWSSNDSQLMTHAQMPTGA